MCLEIAEHLNISIFTIPYPPKPIMTSQGTNPPAHGILSQRSSIGTDKNGTNSVHNLQQQQQHRKSSRISKKNVH